MTWEPGKSGNPDGSKKRKRFEAALDRALVQDDYKALRNCVNKVLELAQEGEQWAVLLLRDTLDGKPAQQVVATDNDGRPLAIALVAYARPDDPIQVYPEALPAPIPAETGRGH
jgi:hypothetical protein